MLEIPSGAVADTSGRRRAMMVSFISYIISFLIFSFTANFIFFAAGMLFFASGEAFRSGTHKSMIMEYLDLEGRSDEQVQFYGKTRSASRLGSALSAILSALIVYFAGNYSSVFLVTIIPYSMDLGLMFTYPARLDGALSSTKISWARIWHKLKQTFQAVQHSKNLRRIITNASVYDSLFKIGKDYLQPIIRTQAAALPILFFIDDQTSRTALLIGIVYFFIYLNSFISSRNSSRLMTKVGEMDRALNLIAVFTGVMYAIAGTFLHFNFEFLTIGVFLTFYTLYNFRKPMVVGYVSQHTDRDQRATVLSGHSQLRSISGMIIAPLFGLLADKVGIFSLFWFSSLVLFLLGTIFKITKLSDS